MRFVGDSGSFEVGTIAAGERAKLPADAIAIVQQMILWWPDDGLLWWQLAELYNAQGDLKSAARAFKLCTEEAKYTNHELRSHFEQVLAAVQSQVEGENREKQLRDTAEAEQLRLADQERRQNILVVAGLVAAMLLLVSYWQLRELVRRFQARRARAARDKQLS